MTSDERLSGQRAPRLTPTIALWLALAPALGFLLSPRPATASDGVLEINQSCATVTGCFAGDSAGLPVTITTPGSYRLTSPLAVPDENTHGILVDADDVAIDLNGFAIQGPVVCTGNPLVCSVATGSGSGVSASFSERVSVRNGSVNGMGFVGIRLGLHGEVVGVRAASNRAVGIVASSGSLVSGNSTSSNGVGISAGTSSVVSGNVALTNRTDGIISSDGTLITGNSAFGNGEDGLNVGGGSLVSGNVAYLNGGHGISVLVGATVSHNTAYSNQQDGIRSAAGCTVVGNTVRTNDGFGLTLGAQTGYRENGITGNSAGTVSGTSLVNLGNNVCNGSATCP